MAIELQLNRVIEQVGKDKGIDKDVLVQAVEAAMVTAAKKKFGMEREIEAQFSADLGEIELFEFKTVAENIENPLLEITLEEGKTIDPECEVGDELGVKMDTSGFGRIAAQTAKQVIIQKIRDAERDIIYREYQGRKGELVAGIVRRFEKGSIIVDLGRTEAIIPQREQVPGERYNVGDRVQAYFMDIQKESRGPQVVLSRTSPEFVSRLFEAEVPEIAEGIIKVMAVAREPGQRTKISVYSRDSDVDPVGACVGMKGSRVQSVVQELRGEKIDIIPWSEDPARFVCNAIAPAQVAKVVIDEKHHAMELIVPDDQLSLAIGKKGQNVRLCAKLTVWKIDIHSESKVEELNNRIKASLIKIPSLGENLALVVFNNGYRSLREVSEAKPEAIKDLLKLDDERVGKIIKEAGELADEEERLAAEGEEAGGEEAKPAEKEVAVAEKVEIEEEVKADVVEAAAVSEGEAEEVSEEEAEVDKGEGEEEGEETKVEEVGENKE